MNISNIYTWQEFKYNIRFELDHTQDIYQSLDLFNHELNNLNIPESQYFNIIYKIQTADNAIRTFSYMQTIKKSQIESLKDIFKEHYRLISSEYGDDFLQKISHIIYGFKLIKICTNQIEKKIYIMR